MLSSRHDSNQSTTQINQFFKCSLPDTTQIKRPRLKSINQSPHRTAVLLFSSVFGLNGALINIDWFESCLEESIWKIQNMKTVYSSRFVRVIMLIFAFWKKSSLQAGSTSALKNWCAKRERPRVEVEEQQKTMIKEDPNVFRYDEHLDSDDEGKELSWH